MNEELLETMFKLLNNKEKIKKLDNNKIILQYANETIYVTERELIKLSKNREEIQCIIQEFNSKKDDEYMLVAYHDGKIIGHKITIDSPVHPL